MLLILHPRARAITFHSLDAVSYLHQGTWGCIVQLYMGGASYNCTWGCIVHDMGVHRTCR